MAKRSSLLALVSILAGALAGCLSPDATPTPTLFLLPTTPPLTDTPPPPPPTDDVVANIPTPTPLFGSGTAASLGDHEPGICEHLLWPIVDGATWTYRMTTPQGSSDLTVAATVDEFGATLTSGTTTSLMLCGDGILAGLPPLPIGHPNLGTNISGNNPSGEYLPTGAVILPLGQPAQWDMDIDTAGAVVISQIGGSTPLSINGGKIAIVQGTNPLETVTVLAGEFLALPVRQDVLMDLQVQTQGVSVESIIISATVTTYFAEGIGPVLAVYDGGTVSSASGAWSLPGGSRLELVSASHP